MKKLLLVLGLGITLMSCSKEEIPTETEPNLIDTLIGKTYLYSEDDSKGILFQRNIFHTTLNQYYVEDCFLTYEWDNEEVILVNSTPTEYWITITNEIFYREIKYSKGTDGGLILMGMGQSVITLYEQSVVICN